MTQWSAADAGSSGLRAALGEVLARLRRAAVDGVVPEHVFIESVRALALGDAERERLRQELARLGLPVRELQMHAGGDRRDGEKVVQDRVENVFSCLSLVQDLLARYMDADGYVTPRVVDGVIRLAGLGAHEAAQLRARALVRDSEGEPDVGNGEESDEPDASDGAEDAEAEAPDPGEDASAGDPPRGDLAESVAAAHAVLDTDRRVRRPGSRLLSAQAEVGLAVLLRGGPNRIAQEPDEDELKALPPEDLRIRARDCLVVHNQRLVRSLVRPYQDQGLDYEDLLQHGFLGLLRAARKFDPTMGNKFSTYATWWIRQSITRAIADEGALIRVPVHMHEQMRKVARAERALAAEGRHAGDADVAVRCDMTLQKVQEIRKLTRRTDSLDRVIGDGATLADFVAETHVLPSVERQVVGALFAEDILAVVATFTEREARILVRRLGLDGDPPSTLDDLGREFGVTRERIRQIEGKARPVLRQRVREAGLVDLDAVCEKAERIAEARRVARNARSLHAVRRAHVRLGFRRVRAERLAQERAGRAAAETSAPNPAGEETEEEHDAPVAEKTREERGIAMAEAESVVAATVQETPGVEVMTQATVPDVVAADWERACRLSESPVDRLWWLVGYARAALGDDDLAALLGYAMAHDVVRGTREGRGVPRPVLTALEVLRRVFDALVAAGQRPEGFFDRPASALLGATPRDYLVRRPLVNRESRLAVRDALREFLAEAPGVPEARRAPEEQAPEEQAQEVGPDVSEDPPTAAEVVTDTDGDRPPDPPVASSLTTAADWDKALTLKQPLLSGGATWLAEYALTALGHRQLAGLLGASSADAVVRAARDRGTLDRHVVHALESLGRVFDQLKQLGLRPEHFFDTPAEALAGVTPRAYLATRPLVHAESRLFLRHALQAFAAVPPTAPATVHDGMGTSGAPTAGARNGTLAAPPADIVASGKPPADAEQRLAQLLARHETELASLTREHEHRLAEERTAADERVAQVRAEVEQQLDAWEETLLHRADRSWERREKQMRRQAEERHAGLKEQHREAYQALLRRAEDAEQATRAAADTGQRAHALEQKLREYREGAEARIRDLESRLAEAQTATAERERAAGAWVAELETRVRTAEAALGEREQTAASAREEYRRGAQLRVAEVEARLRAAEAAVAQRDRLAEAARRRAEEADQEAARRIAQDRHDAWLRVTELQTQLGEVQAQLAAAQETADRGRGSLRDRWRRS